MGNAYYHPEIREIPGALLSPFTTAPESSEQPLTVQTILPLPEALKGPSQAGDQGQGTDGAKDKGKGMETKPSSKAKDAVKAKAKETKGKTKEINPQAKDVLASQPSEKEDPPKAKK